MATFIEGSLLQEPDELILVNNEYYAVYNYETTGGSIMPLVVDIDLPESLLDTALNQAIAYTETEFADAYGYAFFPMFNLSDLKLLDPKNPKTDVDWLLENVENDLQKKAKTFGKTWYLDDEVQQLFAYGAITGQDISPYLENLTWFQDHTPEELKFIELVYTNPEKAAKLVQDNYTALKVQVAQMGISGEGVDDLVRELASDIAQGTLTTAQAAQNISYLIDPYRMAMAGGSSALTDGYSSFIERINPTQNGIADAKSLITNYLGVDATEAFTANGVVEKYAALLRADAAQGEGVTANRDTIISQLQTAHDKLFPGYEGSQHSLWSAPLYRTFQTITGKSALSSTDKKNVDVISQKVGGDMTLFAGEIRKQYENDATYQDQVLGSMANVFKQDVSGVFTGQSLVG